MDPSVKPDKVPIKTLLFVTDLDKTLLDDNAQVPRECLEAAAQFVEQGGLFTVATGRPTRGAMLYPELMELVNLPIITYNGGCIYDVKAGRVLWRQFLPESVRPSLSEALERFQQVGFLIFRGEDDFTCAVRENAYTREISWNREQYQAPLLPIASVPVPWNKIVAAGPKDQIALCGEFLKANIPDPVTLVISEGQFIELNGPRVGKGLALRRLAEMFHLSQDKVVAIGDSMNDMGMLQWAGTGVAVANGEPELKAVADRLVCSNQEHGVRQCVEQILLPMLHQAGPASGL